MTAPVLEAQRFGTALVLGAGLGLFYGFLRFFRPRALGDLFFVLAAFGTWIYLGFGICGGDLRFGYSLGMLLGGFGWELTLGRLLRPVFRRFWDIIGKIWGLLWWPLGRICIIFRKIFKFLLAGAKKWVTIIKERLRPPGRRSGGVTHGRKKSTHPRDLSQEQLADEGGAVGGRRVVYGGGGRPERLY